MRDFWRLLLRNRNYRFTWLGQVVSEIGDHFNTIAVFHLALQMTGSGFVVSGVLLSRAIAVVAAGPLAGVLLDRLDRRRLMIWSDLFRAAISVCFLLALRFPEVWLLYLLSALLMFASPFFTSGRASILPVIASKDELHTANSLTQTTQWTALTVGTLLGGTSVMGFGYAAAFVFNAASFVISAYCIGRLRIEGGSFVSRQAVDRARQRGKGLDDYLDGLRYLRGVPLLFALALVNVGWASGGGTAQIMFTLFGEKVFNRGAAGTGIIWSCAGVGLLCGAPIGHYLGRTLSFPGYKRAIGIAYFIHGLSYVLFSQAQGFAGACFWIGVSRAAVGVTSVLNMAKLLRHVDDAYRGRVFSTMESLNWGTMMLSMTAAGAASDYYPIRTIAGIAGVLSGSTSIFWTLASWRGKIPEPAATDRHD
ncbi:MAG: MFS transporter [Bryobacterales bacterium]|nr:MFS transporter [Bryobacterales bacterium]